MNFKFLLLILFILLPVSAFPDEAKTNWIAVTNEIDNKLNEAYVLYNAGNVVKAKGKITDAYFEVFEGKGMETAIKLKISEDRVYELEAMFGNIRKAIEQKASPLELKNMIDALKKALEEDARKMDETVKLRGNASHISFFFDSFIIIVREGFEAILVISALTAYLAKTNHKDKVKAVYKGALAALAASILTAVLLQTVIKISGAGREAMEGITMLFATAVLFYVSYWLITKIEVARWQHYIKSKVEGSLTKGNVFALGFASFLAVYREGAETILFYQALHSTADDNIGAIITGFGAGSFVLAGLFIMIKYGSVRIPIAPFFAVTSTLLYYLAFTFAGKGILELQEAEWISITGIKGFPTIGLLGIYPTLEGILIQGLLVLALIASVVYSFILKPYKERVKTTNDISHIESDINSIHEILDDVSKHTTICHRLSAGIADKEIYEVRKHLVDIDSKIHDVIEHLTKLEKGLEDIFSELEREIKG